MDTNLERKKSRRHLVPKVDLDDRDPRFAGSNPAEVDDFF